MLSLLQFLIIENQQKLKGAISRLEPFPDIPEFRELRSVQHRLKYSSGSFELRQVTQTTHRLTESPPFLLSLFISKLLAYVKKRSWYWVSIDLKWTYFLFFVQEITHFLSASSCDSLALTRLEGLKELTRQLHNNKGQIQELLRECHGLMPKKSVLAWIKICMQHSFYWPFLFLSSVANPTDSVLVKLVLSLLQLCKLATNHPGGDSILGTQYEPKLLHHHVKVLIYGLDLNFHTLLILDRLVYIRIQYIGQVFFTYKVFDELLLRSKTWNVNKEWK